MTAKIARYTFKGLAGLVGFDQLPPSSKHTMSWVNAEDGGETRGILYEKGGEKAVVVISHPRASVLTHYLVPYLLNGGFAVYCQEGRYINNDVFCIHELCLLDVAASVRFLRGRGFEFVIALGNSGGGSLYSFYQAQAELAPPNRLTTTAAGDPLDLNAFDMTPFDGFAVVAAHAGQGLFLLGTIDPSVTDELNPAAVNPDLDMYSPANGFRGFDKPAKYSDEFIRRYREAQSARVARLDALARQRIEAQRAAERVCGVSEKDADIAREFARRSMSASVMVVYRTEADLRFLDLSIDPSKRGIGSMASVRTDLANFGDSGHARVLAPRAWLSTWSGLSSRAAMTKNIGKISVPTLFCWYQADNGVFQDTIDACHAAAKMTDRQTLEFDLDHYGRSRTDQSTAGRDEVGAALVTWLRERWPAH